jgi:thiol-disulfide isomerase/thioredoxin
MPEFANFCMLLALRTPRFLQELLAMRRALLTRLTAAVGVLAFASFCAADEKILNIGDPAPPLAVSSFVKGDKVEKFEPGKTYVVEFWATWCGPCKASIPHLTELAHQYKDKGVQMIGVDVFEQDTTLVEPFVKEMGDKMDYTVALDMVAEGGEPNEGTMATTWLKAAEEHGIPIAFVVRDGKIQWIGHPMSMEEPLAKIVAGDWNAESMGRERLAKKQTEKKLDEIGATLMAFQRAKNYKGMAATIDEATASDAALAKQLAWMKFMALCNGADVERGLQLGETLKKDDWDNAGMLNRNAMNVVDPSVENVDPRVAKLAVEFATRANELTKEQNFQVLDTLAQAKFRAGDFTGAVDSEEKAIKALQDYMRNVRDGSMFSKFLRQYEGQLEKFQKAAEKKEAA